MDKKKDTFGKVGDSFFEEKNEIKKVLANKRKRLQDNIKVENIQKIANLNNAKKKVEEENAQKIIELNNEKKKKIEKINEEINVIESGEKMRLSEVDKKISEEEMELISALEEEIKIKTIFSKVKKK